MEQQLDTVPPPLDRDSFATYDRIGTSTVDCEQNLSVTHELPNLATESPAAIIDRAVTDMARRIARDLPEVPISEVLAALQNHLAKTRDAKVQNFRLLLAERQTRWLLSPGHRLLADRPD
jgi:hypothetical protein